MKALNGLKGQGRHRVLIVTIFPREFRVDHGWGGKRSGQEAGGAGSGAISAHGEFSGWCQQAFWLHGEQPVYLSPGIVQSPGQLRARGEHAHPGLVSSRCCKKSPQTWWLKTTRSII